MNTRRTIMDAPLPIWARLSLSAEGEGEGGAGGEENKGEDKKGEGEGGADDKGEGDDAKALRETWGKSWRDLTAGDDKDFRKRLDRYASYDEFVRASRETERRLREGGKVTIPKADAKAEEIAAFREATKGTILEAPEKPEDYGVKPTIPEGKKLPEEAAPVLGLVLAKGHEAGFTRGQMQVAQDLVAQLFIDAETSADSNMADGVKKGRAALEEIWPGEVDDNLRFANLGSRHYCQAVGVDPDELGRTRLADGSLLGNNPLFARVMAHLGRGVDEDPAFGAENDNDGASTITKLEAEKREIMALMKGSQADRNKYDSPETQRRLDQINAALARAQGRKSA